MCVCAGKIKKIIKNKQKKVFIYLFIIIYLVFWKLIYREHTHTYLMTIEGTTTFNKSEARQLQFYSAVKGYKRVKRSDLIKIMGVSIGLFQHEYTTYLQEYTQIQYDKKTKEFVFNP